MRNNDFWEKIEDVNAPKTPKKNNVKKKLVSIAKLVGSFLKRNKKLFLIGSAALVSLSLILFVLSVTVFWSETVDGVVYKRTGGFFAAVEYEGTEESVTVKSKIGKKDITVIADGAFANNTALREIVIEEGIEYIGSPPQSPKAEHSQTVLPLSA